MDNLNNRYTPVRERIFTLLKSKGIQQKDFAEMVGVYSSTITDWKKGRSLSFAKKLDVIAQILGTTEEWLLTGEAGEKSEAVFVKQLLQISNDQLPVTECIHGEKETPAPSDGDGPPIDEKRLDEQLIQRLCSLTPEEQGKVDAFVQGLIASRQNPVRLTAPPGNEKKDAL